MTRPAPLLILAALSACAPAPLPELDDSFIAEAVAFLDTIQPRSIAENREYCGYFGIGPNQTFVATTPSPGGPDFCDLHVFPQDFDVIASYHTHSSYDPDSDSEVPSTDDIRSDIADHTYGFIATPGGRVWLVDPDQRAAEQICGRGCVTQDRNFVPEPPGSIKDYYTLSDIAARQS